MLAFDATRVGHTMVANMFTWAIFISFFTVVTYTRKLQVLGNVDPNLEVDRPDMKNRFEREGHQVGETCMVHMHVHIFQLRST